MKPFARSERISVKIQSALSELICKKINDPRLEMVTITGVKMTQDLREAYIYFSVSGGEKAKKDAVHGFKSASAFMRKYLAGQLGLRYMPQLQFHYDNSFDYGAHIDSVLDSLKKESQD